MLIDEAREQITEPIIAAAKFSTSEDSWIDTFASELGILILLVFALLWFATKPFRKTREVAEKPFATYDGAVYMVVTKSRIVFYETTDNWFSSGLGPILAEHDRSSCISIDRAGKTATLRFESGHAYQLIWRDSSFAWENVAATLNTAVRS